MPIDVLEYVPAQVLYVAGQGVISEDDFFKMDRQIIQFLETLTSPFGHLIFDVRHVTEGQKIKTLVKTKSGRHPRLGWSIEFGIDTPVHNFLVSVTTKIFKARLRRVPTFSEGIEFLQSMDDTLPDLNVPTYRQKISNYIPPDVQI